MGLLDKGKSGEKMGEIADRLRHIDLLQDLTPLQAAVLATFVQTIPVAAGDTVLHAAERSDELYIIESGQARVTPAGSDQASTLGPGDYFGEIALLTGQGRTADVAALTSMVLFKLTRGAYESYLRKVSPEVQRQVTETSSARQKKAGPEGGSIA